MQDEKQRKRKANQSTSKTAKKKGSNVKGGIKNVFASAKQQRKKRVNRQNEFNDDFDSWQVDNYAEYRPKDTYYPKREERARSKNDSVKNKAQKQKESQPQKPARKRKEGAVETYGRVNVPKKANREYPDGFFVDEVEFRKQKQKEKRLREKEQDETEKRKSKVREPLTKKKRKIRNLIMSASILAVVILAGVVLSLTVLFKCEAVQVDGLTKYSAEQIIEVSGISNGENLFLSDRKTAKNNIMAVFPYISDVDITIQIPSTMHIQVKEAVPSYLIKNKNQYIVVSETGRILTHTEDDKLNVPIISGCKLSSIKVGDYIEIEDQNVMPIINEISQALQRNNVAGIREINIASIANIKLNYENRINIIIGVPEELDYKLRTAMKIITGELGVTDKGDLDVSRCHEEKREARFIPDLSITEQPTTASAQGESSTPPQSALDTDADTGPVDNDTATEDDGSYGEGYDDGYADGGYDNYDDYGNDDYGDAGSEYEQDVYGAEIYE